MHVQSSQSDWITRAQAVLPAGGFGNFDPSVIIREGRGSRVWDEDGKEYVDYLIGSGPMILGHGHPEVLEAVFEQLPRGMTFFANNAAGIELAEEICRACPAPNSCAMSRPGARPTCTRCGWRAPSPGATRSSNSRADTTACRRKRR
jgi:glutamate-1-semialdehyde aminotransferase